MSRKEIHEHMVRTLGDDSPSYLTIKKWVASYKRCKCLRQSEGPGLCRLLLKAAPLCVCGTAKNCVGCHIKDRRKNGAGRKRYHPICLEIPILRFPPSRKNVNQSALSIFPHLPLIGRKEGNSQNRGFEAGKTSTGKSVSGNPQNFRIGAYRTRRYVYKRCVSCAMPAGGEPLCNPLGASLLLGRILDNHAQGPGQQHRVRSYSACVCDIGSINRGWVGEALVHVHLGSTPTSSEPSPPQLRARSETSTMSLQFEIFSSKQDRCTCESQFQTFDRDSVCCQSREKFDGSDELKRRDRAMAARYREILLGQRGYLRPPARRLRRARSGHGHENPVGKRGLLTLT
ncbi:hypothetical protein Bbelb_014590 [Branchiostoma belcheri]|nr:hypothetical protein Bbelb_014590 [Branchiostoma belcheri]